MGMWSSPFDSVEQALKLQELMSKPWILINDNGLKTLPESYDLVGDDSLFDYLDECSEGEDVRPIVKQFLKKWVKNMDDFFKVDKEALKIVKQIINE
jgi:hypothetical protein